MNVDVQEFYPRVHSVNGEPEAKVNGAESPADLEQREFAPLSKPKGAAHKASKPSQLSKPPSGRASKKEIIEGIKSMEQQNIDLMASKLQTLSSASRNDDWNVIKKGKKVKVVKSSSDVPEEGKKDKDEETKIEAPKMQTAAISEPVKKSPPVQQAKAKKSKNKSKKKKPHQLVKQDGFEIIEPEFNHVPSNEVAETPQATPDLSDEETVVESEEIPTEAAISEPEVAEKLVLKDVETVVAFEAEIVTEKAEEVSQVEAAEEQSPIANDLQTVAEDDTVIDISDEDICCKAAVPLELTSIREDEQAVELVKVVKPVEKEVPSPKPKVQRGKPDALTISDPFLDKEFFNDRSNIAMLERDLIENLRLLDDEIDIKSPIINPLFDFPITSAVQKWLQAKQNESFDSLFHVQNFKKLRELYDDGEDDETTSDISEKELKSETDSDYASDIQAKANGASPTCSTHAKGSSSKCNKLIAKESFCALM